MLLPLSEEVTLFVGEKVGERVGEVVALLLPATVTESSGVDFMVPLMEEVGEAVKDTLTVEETVIDKEVVKLTDMVGQLEEEGDKVVVADMVPLPEYVGEAV